MALQTATLKEAGAMDHLILGGKAVIATSFVAFAAISSLLAGGFLPDTWDPWVRDLITLASTITAIGVIWAKFLRHITAAARAFVDGVAHVADLSESVKGMQQDIGGLRKELAATVIAHDKDIAATVIAHDKDIAEIRKSLVDELEENARQHADLVHRPDEMTPRDR